MTGNSFHSFTCNLCSCMLTCLNVYKLLSLFLVCSLRIYINEMLLGCVDMQPAGQSPDPLSRRMDFLFPLLKNSKSGIDDRGHRLRSGSPVTNLPGAPPVTAVLSTFCCLRKSGPSGFSMYPSFEFGVSLLRSVHPRFSVSEKICPPK